MCGSTAGEIVEGNVVGMSAATRQLQGDDVCGQHIGSILLGGEWGAGFMSVGDNVHDEEAGRWRGVLDLYMRQESEVGTYI